MQSNKNTLTIKDWPKVVRSLILHMKKNGFIPHVVSDSVDRRFAENAKQDAEFVCSCDEGSIKFITKEGGYIKALLVLGNEPEEIVADYSYNDRELSEKFDEVYFEWSDKWADKPCPMKTITL